VPSSSRIVRLETGKEFDVAPLLRLLHAGNSLSANIA
jgi:hypothetical protein